MKKRILAYRKEMDELLAHPTDGICWEQVLERHLVQISFFQHERLIHLIVTALVALLAVITAGVALVGCCPQAALLTLGLLVLLVPYLFHYYTLENEVQKMYGQYDQIFNRKTGQEKL